MRKRAMNKTTKRPDVLSSSLDDLEEEEKKNLTSNDEAKDLQWAGDGGGRKVGKKFWHGPPSLLPTSTSLPEIFYGAPGQLRPISDCLSRAWSIIGPAFALAAALKPWR